MPLTYKPNLDTTERKFHTTVYSILNRKEETSEHGCVRLYPSVMQTNSRQEGRGEYQCHHRMSMKVFWGEKALYCLCR